MKTIDQIPAKEFYKIDYSIYNKKTKGCGGRNRNKSTHCIHGHEYTEENTGYYGPHKYRYCKDCQKQYRNNNKDEINLRRSKNRLLRKNQEIGPKAELMTQ
jgi:hypothetical protein